MQLQFQFVIGFFETFLVDGKFKGLSNKPSHARFWHFLQKLWRFLFFISNEGMLSAIAIAVEFAQNNLKQPKTTKYGQNLPKNN
jgi:hypothetical protein